MNVKLQTACFVIKTITVNNFAALFNCTPAGRVSDLIRKFQPKEFQLS